MSNNEWKEATGSNWKPEEKGESLEGILVDVQTDVGQNNSMLYTFRTEDGNMGVWGSAVLDSRMKGIKVGEEVKIVYDGLGEAAKGKKPPKLWKVFHREPEGDSIPF